MGYLETILNALKMFSCIAYNKYYLQMNFVPGTTSVPENTKINEQLTSSLQVV